MDTFLHKFGDKIKGVLEGFDRIVFKGILRPLCFPLGMQMFLSRYGVLNKHYKDWVIEKSTAIIQDAEEYSKQQSGMGIQYLPSCHIRKEEQAHEQQKKSGIQTGLIGVWSCVESCNTFKAVFDKTIGFPQIKPENSRCKHLYFYYDHKDYGFMSIRLQTWAPFEVQIALNGREWLKRLLDKSGKKYVLDGNKFLDVEDYSLAQTLLDSQRSVRWIEMLSGFIPYVFPSMPKLLGEDMSYTWTLWQSEWAKDYIFYDPQVLGKYMESLLRHALITGTSERVLRYMGRPVRSNGQPHWSADPKLLTRVKQWYDGGRLRHWVDKNSLKFYNEQNVLRFEFTMNDPGKYKIHRTVDGDDSGEKRFLPMRKGIADISARTQICSARIKSFTEQTAAMSSDMTVSDILSGVSKAKRQKEKRYRALDVTGKDLELLRAVADPKYNVDAITNKHLQKALLKTDWAKGLEDRKLASRISRHLRLLREHGLIRKLQKQHKYMLTDKGRLLTTSLNQFLGAKVSDLSKLAA
jgi:DNA-binding transcriptional ArsR family regulator